MSSRQEQQAEAGNSMAFLPLPTAPAPDYLRLIPAVLHNYYLRPRQ
ncbi:MAG TPA: hypothetical protein VL866_10140 [Pyrinomonadaceae bacterium]|nr:hypothetical protein [Pyrinomonadaceae bacterium]